MSLEDAYSQVPNKKIIGLSVGSNFPLIQKDPIINKLENDVFSLMNELDKKENPIPIVTKSQELKSFSYEDAIKELQTMLKKDK
jgi:hypothetical protein